MIQYFSDFRKTFQKKKKKPLFLYYSLKRSDWANFVP